MPSLSSLYSAMLLALAMAVLCISPASSTSRRALEQPTLQNGFRISLEHIDSGSNFTKFERIQRAMIRGRHRLQSLSEMAMAAAASGSSDIDAPVLSGNGEFLMKLSIGTPPEPFSAIMDTGSDLIWTQCKPCKQCFDQSTPVFDPVKSSTFSKLSCSSELCKSLPAKKCTDGCQYFYLYGDYSSTQGFIATETFTFDNVSVPNLGFGCGEDNEGYGFGQGAGLVGLGRGQLSLVSQLKEPKFSYCLTSTDDTKSASILLMGSLATANITNQTAIITTPLIQSPPQPSFYYLSLEGISVGDTRLPINKSTFALQEDGSGGLIIDSGTTITYIEEIAFDLVKKEFINRTPLSVYPNSNAVTGLDLCFRLPAWEKTLVDFPKLVFHFEGGDLQMPEENYMIGDSSMEVICLAMGRSRGMSIFGNIQQQNMLVFHDLGKETLSFVPTQCNKL